jgi:hypothetical protein
MRRVPAVSICVFSLDERGRAQRAMLRPNGGNGGHGLLMTVILEVWH